MEDNNNRSTDDSPSRDAVRSESAGIRFEDSWDQYDNNYYKACGCVIGTSDRDCPDCDSDDTAPFNVAAFLQYLHNRDNNFGNDK